MTRELFVSSTPHETKVGMVEDDLLAEIYLERENEYTLAGSIYKGRVTRVLPGMQSAFVDIGLERDAFLYVSDFMELEDSEDLDEVPTNRPAPERVDSFRVLARDEPVEPRGGDAVAGVLDDAAHAVSRVLDAPRDFAVGWRVLERVLDEFVDHQAQRHGLLGVQRRLHGTGVKNDRTIVPLVSSGTPAPASSSAWSLTSVGL